MHRAVHRPSKLESQAQPSLEGCKPDDFRPEFPYLRNTVAESTWYLHIPGTQKVLCRCQLCWLRMTQQALINGPPARVQQRPPSGMRFSHDTALPMPSLVPAIQVLGLVMSLLAAAQAYFLICRLLIGGWLPEDHFCTSKGYTSGCQVTIVNKTVLKVFWF